jgi:hypothetical protein
MRDLLLPPSHHGIFTPFWDLPVWCNKRAEINLESNGLEIGP